MTITLSQELIELEETFDDYFSFDRIFPRSFEYCIYPKILDVTRNDCNLFSNHIFKFRETIKCISNFKYHNCLKCYKKNTIRSYKICHLCKKELLKRYIIKNTFNNITKTLPIELVNIICNYI